MSTITRTARIACAREHAQLVRGVVEVAELAHQPLGVQRPAFAVARDEAERALERAELVGEVLHLRDLQVMARERPRGSRCSPRATAGSGSCPASGTTCGRAGRSPRSGPCSTSRPRRPGGAIIASHRAQRLGDVEVRAVELGDRAVDELLVPRAELRRRLRSRGAGRARGSSITAATGSPGRMRSPTDRIACSMRCSSSHPHSYVSSRSSSMPLNARARTARSARGRRDRAGRPRARTRRGGTRPSFAYGGRASLGCFGDGALHDACRSPRGGRRACEKNGGRRRRRPTSSACRAQPSAWRRARDESPADPCAQRRLEAGDGTRAPASMRAASDLPVVVGVERHEVEAPRGSPAPGCR